MNVHGKTKIVGIIGYPVEHTISPPMHNAAFTHLGLDFCYVPFQTHPDRLQDALAGLRALSIRGVNVTVPHKENVIPLLDNVDKEAAYIGAVNTIRNDDGILTGYNTDGRGFMRSLAEEGIDVKDKKVLIIGAGGAARAIGYYLCKEADKVCLYDVDADKADALSKHLDGIRGNAEKTDMETEEGRDIIRGSDIIVNATPLGLKPNDPLPLDVKLIRPEQAVCDLIYKETQLLKAAARTGCKTLDGSGMLLWQGVLAFEIWTDIKPPAEIMKEALLRLMSG
jgi:shikimate dehydrogenase